MANELEVVRLVGEVLGIAVLLGTLAIKVMGSLSRLHGKVDNLTSDVSRINGSIAGHLKAHEGPDGFDRRLGQVEGWIKGEATSDSRQRVYVHGVQDLGLEGNEALPRRQGCSGVITSDGWFDWMKRDAGPADKTYDTPNSVDCYVPHSAVGYYTGWKSRLFSPNRNPDGTYTAYAAASIHGWIEQDGVCIQHYPVTASVWGSGARLINVRAIAFENAGGPPGNESEPLTEGQIEANVRILRDLAAWKGVGLDYWVRPVSGGDQLATLYEHTECTRFGSAPTACPSGRIPWPVILSRLQTPEGDDDMKILHWAGNPNGPASLLVGGRALYIPPAIYDELVKIVYGPSPAAPSQECWDWLKANKVYVET